MKNKIIEALQESIHETFAKYFADFKEILFHEFSA